MLLKKLFVLIFAFFLMLGCKDKNHIAKPDPLMEEAQYLDLLFELNILKVYQSRGTPGSVVDSLYTEIFKKHEADSTLFRVSHQYYQTQLEQQQVRVDSLIVRLNKEILPFDKQDSLKLKTQEVEIKE